MRFRFKRTALCALVVALAALVVGGCGSGSDSGDSGSDGGKSGGKTYRIGVVLPDITSVYFASIVNGAKDSAGENPGVELSVTSTTAGANSITTMINNINDLVTKGVDGIVVGDGFPQLTPTLKRVLDRRIPVVFVDANIGPIPSSQIPTVGTDPVTAGQNAGEFIVRALQGRGEVGLLNGLPGIKANLDRTQSAKAAFEGTDIRVVAELPTDCDRVKAITATKDMLTAHPEIDLLYTACGPPGLGIVQALKQLGLTDKVKVVGFDASDPELQEIRAGNMLGSMAQFPRRQGQIAIRSLVEAIDSGTTPTGADSGTEMITRENVDTVRNN